MAKKSKGAALAEYIVLRAACAVVNAVPYPVGIAEKQSSSVIFTSRQYSHMRFSLKYRSAISLPARPGMSLFATAFS